MGCCCTEAIVAALGDVAKELRKIRNLQWPLASPKQWPAAIGLGKQIDKVLGDDMKTTYIVVEQNVRPLPEKTGRNKDIDHALLIVVANDQEVERHNVAFDLETRQPVGPVQWKAPKGSDVVLKYGYVDDDGLCSELVAFPYGVAADTIAPDAPSDGAVGSARVIDEIEIDDGSSVPEGDGGAEG